MALENLKDVYIDQLQDIYSANRQSKAATDQLVGLASNSELKTALKAGVEGIEKGMNDVAEIIRSHGADPTGEFCKGMEGIAKEVQAHVIDADFSDQSVRDAMIITQYQRMVHYGIAGYGCTVAFAKRLGLNEDAKTLQNCLDQTYDGDRHMTEIAEKDVNTAAA